MQHLIEDEEFKKLLTEQYVKGFSEGRDQMISVFRQFKAGLGHQVEVRKNAETNLKDFVRELNEIFTKE